MTAGYVFTPPDEFELLDTELGSNEELDELDDDFELEGCELEGCELEDFELAELELGEGMTFLARGGWVKPAAFSPPGLAHSMQSERAFSVDAGRSAERRTATFRRSRR